MISKVSQTIYVYKASLVRVVDGDTIEMDIDLGFKIRWTTMVRFIDVDTYEIRGTNAHPLGQVAKKFVEDAIARFGPNFYFKSDRDEITIYNRAGGSIYLETIQDGKRAFVDLTASLKANGLDESDPRPLNIGDPIYVTIVADDIMDLFV